FARLEQRALRRTGDSDRRWEIRIGAVGLQLQIEIDIAATRVLMHLHRDHIPAAHEKSWIEFNREENPALEASHLASRCTAHNQSSVRQIDAVDLLAIQVDHGSI